MFVCLFGLASFSNMVFIVLCKFFSNCLSCQSNKQVGTGKRMEKVKKTDKLALDLIDAIYYFPFLFGFELGHFVCGTYSVFEMTLF